MGSQFKVRGSSFLADELTQRLDVGVEIDTGRKYLGEKVYRKLLAVAAGPNNSTVQVAHGITSPAVFVRLSGMLEKASNPSFPLPVIISAGISSSVELRADGTNVELVGGAGKNWSTWSGFVLVEYTY